MATVNIDGSLCLCFKIGISVRTMLFTPTIRARLFSTTIMFRLAAVVIPRQEKSLALEFGIATATGCELK